MLPRFYTIFSSTFNWWRVAVGFCILFVKSFALYNTRLENLMKFLAAKPCVIAMSAVLAIVAYFPIAFSTQFHFDSFSYTSRNSATHSMRSTKLPTWGKDYNNTVCFLRDHFHVIQVWTVEKLSFCEAKSTKVKFPLFLLQCSLCFSGWMISFCFATLATILNVAVVPGANSVVRSWLFATATAQVLKVFLAHDWACQT